MGTKVDFIQVDDQDFLYGEGPFREARASVWLSGDVTGYVVLQSESVWSAPDADFYRSALFVGGRWVQVRQGRDGELLVRSMQTHRALKPSDTVTAALDGALSAARSALGESREWCQLVRGVHLENLESRAAARERSAAELSGDPVEDADFARMAAEARAEADAFRRALVVLADAPEGAWALTGALMLKGMDAGDAAQAALDIDTKATAAPVRKMRGGAASAAKKGRGV